MTQPLDVRRPPDEIPPPFEKIGIVGLGLIGGSIALAARQAWPKSLVVGVDRREVIEAAIPRHVVDVAGEDLIVLADVDVVILAAPVRQNVSLLADLDENVHRDAIVTDTGGTKRAIVGAAAALPSRLTFVGGHPLAGAAHGGLEYARGDLFRNRPWLLTPRGGSEEGALERLKAFVRGLGGVPQVMSAEEHDRLLAFLSHLPQLTASALMAAVGTAVGEAGLALAGRGLVDTTRLASSPPDIWRDITATNIDEVDRALDALIVLLQDLKHDLSSGERLARTFREAAGWRARLHE